MRHDHSIGARHGTLADPHIAQNLCPCADMNAILYLRRSAGQIASGTGFDCGALTQTATQVLPEWLMLTKQSPART